MIFFLSFSYRIQYLTKFPSLLERKKMDSGNTNYNTKLYKALYTDISNVKLSDVQVIICGLSQERRSTNQICQCPRK